MSYSTEHFKRYINWEYWINNYEEIIKTGFDFPQVFLAWAKWDFQPNWEKINLLLDEYYSNPQKENEYYPILKLIEFTENFPEFKDLIKPEVLNYQNSVALIFSKPPAGNWGLRGDPYFWIYLEEKFIKFSIPFDDIYFFEDIIRKEYFKLSGKKIGEEGYVDEFAHGGMSSGWVSGMWTYYIPFLKYRLIKLNNKYYLNQGEYSKIIKNPKKIIKTTNLSLDEILEDFDRPLRSLRLK